jgi:hypothetical protein
VEADTQQKISMTLIDEIHDGEHADGVKFDVAAIFKYIIEKFGLSEKAKNGTVTIAITIDGAKLEGKLFHVTIGSKIVDVDAVDLKTGKKDIDEHAKWPVVFPCNDDHCKRQQEYIQEVL